LFYGLFYSIEFLNRFDANMIFSYADFKSELLLL